MTRDLQIEFREREEESPADSALSRVGERVDEPGETREREDPAARAPERSFRPGRRELVLDRDRAYRLRDSEWKSLYQIGRFRVVAVGDLAEGIYGGNKALLFQDLRSLREQQLIMRFSMATNRDGRLTLAVLTKAGRRLVESNRRAGEADRVYDGFVKPAESAHDAALYRMFLAEERRIESEGGRVRGIALDYELKQRAYTEIGKSYLAAPEVGYSHHHSEVAEALGLPIVDGQLQFPDVRVEYENCRGESQRVDLELATANYRGGHLAAKVEAGFRLYVPEAILSGPLSGRIYEERGITAEIFAI